MGANRTNYRLLGLLGCAVLAAVAQEVEQDCSADHKCHFGNCEQKNYAVKNVTHNLTTLGCGHPYTVAVLVFPPDEHTSEAHSAAVEQCGRRRLLRPACERRVVKTDLDTLLISIFSAVSLFYVLRLEIHNKIKDS